MFKKVSWLYSEALVWIMPLIKSKKHYEYSQNTRHIREESKSVTQRILSVVWFNKKAVQTEKTLDISQKDEFIQVLIEAKQ